jgi:hypothetical protein
MSKSKEVPEDKVSGEMLGFNMKKIDSFLTMLYIVSGVVSGVLGFTSLRGLFLYIVLSLVITFALLVKMQFDVKKYTVMPVHSLLIHGMSTHAMSFVLFWTLAYALVHIY